MMRGDQLRLEKDYLMETRLAVRKQADRQKRELVARVDRLKRKSKIGRRDLVNLGLVDDDRAAYNEIFGSPTSSQVVEKAGDDGGKIQIQDDETSNPLGKSFDNSTSNPQGQGSIASRAHRQGLNTTNLSPV